ncbi:hypothetical protein AB0L70_03480 [Kribbella sp. NPDC051952]|uniref:hypothetical protein n=1 Tax=Kribbella sp. NPDC051952 TaxID=3154851 RepID=UPI00341BAAED
MWSIALVFIAVVLVCGLSGGVVGESAIGSLGRTVNHSELALRVLGWCWGGLPWTVLAAAIVIRGRARLSRSVWTVLAYLLPVWIGSGAFLLPSRSSSFESRFGTAYPDAHPLGFAWACGVLSLVATLFLLVITLLVIRKLHGKPTKQALHRLTIALAVTWATLTTAGLVAALAAPLP